MEQLAGVIALLVLVGGALIVVAPFVTVLIWGAILAYCSWGPYQKLATWFGGRRAVAALLIVLSILVVLIVPIFIAGTSLATRGPELVANLQDRLAHGVLPLPQWLTRIPLVGPRLDQTWAAIASHNPAVVAQMRELARPLLVGALGAGLELLRGLGLLVLSVLFAAYFYLSGTSIGKALEAGMRRIAGARAPDLLWLVGATVKGVVYGILGTSLVQAVLCGIGFWIAGVPSPALLGLVIFFLAFIPAGPLLVIVPGAIWLYQQGEMAWAIFLIVWCGVAGVAIDNVLKPMIIGRSSNIPFILTLIGVIGGAAAFGLLGVFVGPIQRPAPKPAKQVEPFVPGVPAASMQREAAPSQQRERPK
jgi:predicted PurR-regulated permease PerM